MKAAPESKARTAVYMAVIVVACGIAGYFLFIRGEPPPVLDAKTQEHAAAVGSSVSTPNQPRDLPIEQRPPRGRPVNSK
jgi:hypothetical protein